MNLQDLMEELAKRPLLCDGAMGTELIKHGLTPGACGEKWNTQRPEALAAIHQAYVDAGCDLITTNTFGGTEPALQRHGLDHEVRPLNAAGAAVARVVAGDSRWVLGDVGPFGGFLEPVGDADPRMVAEFFRQQIAALLEGGADAIIIETMSDPLEMQVALHALRDLGDTPAIATYAFQKTDGTFRTMMGTTVPDAIEAAMQAGASVVGANCGTALTLPDYLELARQLVAVADDRPVIIQPNAGAPTTSDGTLVYPATPAQMADLVKPLLDAGVRIIGGCCGTTPDHLRAMADAMRAAR
jgi:5-methyltetrahydrofolate--homocysteine methyltransferase